MDNSGREELLLEVIKDFTRITYPEYADDDNIKEKIYDYIYLLNKFKEKNDGFDHNDLKKINNIHQFFYGVSFDPENPNANIYKTPIFDEFNAIYNKIDKLINETNDLNADLLKSLLNIISVYYEPSKNKDAIINEYLDKVVIPVVNKFKGIGVVADTSLKEEKIIDRKTNTKSEIRKNVINEVKEKAEEKAQKKAEEKAVENEIKKLEITEETARVAKKETEETARVAIKEKEETARVEIKETEETKRKALKNSEGNGEKNVEVKPQNIVEEVNKNSQEEEDQKKVNIEKISVNLYNQLKTDNTSDKTNTSFTDTSKTDEFNINEYDYDTLKEYLQALYLQLDIDKNKKEFIEKIIEKINELKIINLENKSSEELLTHIEEKIKKHLNEKKFDINIFLKKYNDFFINNQEENNNIFKILLLFKVNKKGNYLTSYKLYSNNLKLLNKLFNYPNPAEIKDDFYKNQLKFLINKLTENNDNILDIIENIRLLINLIIEHKKKIYDINFLIQVKECKINDLPDTYNKILILLNLLLKNDDFNSNINGNILTGGGDDDKILSEKKINDINLNLLFNLIKDLKKNKDKGKDDIIKIYKLIIIDDKNKYDDIKNIIENIVKKDTIDLKKTIIIEFNKNINRIFKDEKGNDITEENIINNLCNNTFNLETLINKKKLKELIKLKELASGTKLFYFNYKLVKTIKKTKIINNIEELLSIKDFCTITYNMYPGTEVRFKDIIYIENSKYNLPIIYDDKRNDSYDIIELIFDILNNNDSDYKSKIKKLLLDFNKDFKEVDNIISVLDNLNINTKLKKPEEIKDIITNIGKIDDTKKCFDYMKNNIDFFKTEIAIILSKYNPPKFYVKYNTNPFDIDTLFKDTKYVSDNIVKKDFLKLNLNENKYDDKYYPIEQYITLKNLEYVKKNESLETTYYFCYDEKKTYNKENFINEIIKRIRNSNLNLEDYINIKYIFKNNNNVYYYYLKKYKCQIKEILTLKSNLSFNYFMGSDEPIYNFDRYLSSSSTYNFYKYLYLYFLNKKINKINKINYSSIIYDHCKENINIFITKEITKLEFKKPIELDFFEKIEEAKENLKDKLEKILKKEIQIDKDKSYEEIIVDIFKINPDLFNHIDIKNFNISNSTNNSENNQILIKNIDNKCFINLNSSDNTLVKNDNGNFYIKDFLILKKDNFNIRNLLIKISSGIRTNALAARTNALNVARTNALNAALTAALTAARPAALAATLAAALTDALTDALAARPAALDGVIVSALTAARPAALDFVIVSANPADIADLAYLGAYLAARDEHNVSHNVLAVRAAKLANRPAALTTALTAASPAALTAALNAVSPDTRNVALTIALTAASPAALTAALNAAPPDTRNAALIAALTDAPRNVTRTAALNYALLNAALQAAPPYTSSDDRTALTDARNAARNAAIPSIAHPVFSNAVFPDTRTAAGSKHKKYIEEEEEEISGGYKNIIELEDVFKLYYNSDESITNIYKLYFIINIYGFYYQDDKDKYVLIENILEIIKIDIFNDDIIETIKNLITIIYHKTREIYEYYIRYFDKTDTIIKNYCQTRELINKYLNMNFIYEFYKKYQKKDIKIQVNINGTILKIDKSLDEINKEIDELFINGEGLFQQSSYEISINPYDNEIDNFIHFIYDFTKNQSTISLTNLNDLNAFIVLQLLSNEDDMINLVINGDTYMIKNINNHPYKLHITENFNIQIKLNEVQMGLYKQLFEMEDIRSLLGILAKEYYYLDFNIQKKSKFKFHLNYEIIPFISSSIIDDSFKRTIINYNSFKPKMIDDVKDLSILSLENDGIIFLINYGILLSSTLFSQINIKNFISLIHIYFIIKNNTKRYLNLYNYIGDNQTIIIYRDYIKSINYIGFLKSILNLMRIKLDLRMDLKTFIKSVINFKENSFIKSVVKIDVNFLQLLYNNKSYKIEEKFIEDFYLSFLLIYKNCLKGRVNNNIIKMFHIFIIPCLRFFHNKINIRDIENEVLDIKASEYIRLIRGIRGGDGDSEQVVNKPEIQNKEINIKKAKEELKENDNVVLTTELSDNTKDILKLLEVFNNLYIEFSKLDLNDILDGFEKIINELFKINDEFYIISENKLDIFDKKLNYKEDKKNYETNLRSVRNKVIDNIRNLEEVIKNYSYHLINEKDMIGNLNDKAKNLAKILDYIDNIDKSLIDETNGIKKYKDKSVEVNNVFLEFFPFDDNQIPLMDNIKEFVTYYKKKFDKFLSILLEAKVKYEIFQKTIEEHDKKAQAYFAEEERTELNAKNERLQELKLKKKENDNNKTKISEEIDKLNKKKEVIEIRINDEDDDAKKGDYKKEIDIINQQINKSLNSIKELDNQKETIDNDISGLRKTKGGGYLKNLPKDTDKNIKDLLDKNDIPFKDKDDKVSFENRKNEIKKRFDNIKKDYRKLKVSTYIPKSVHKDMILEKFINKKGDTLFEQILNNYYKDVKEKNLDIAKANFYESVENNNLDPIKELEITFIDKLIFAFVIIFLRYAGLYITYRFIDNKFVKSIKEAIIYYSLSYVAVLFVFIFIVNVDLFRLRIIFNYCNLHINSTGVLSHMIIKIIIGYIIYLLIINLDNEPIPTYLSKNQNIKLKKKLDILSMIVVIFLLIFVLII